MNIPTQNFIDGQFQDGGGKPITLINPATEEVITEVAGADESTMVAAVETAQRAWQS